MKIVNDARTPPPVSTAISGFGWGGEESKDQEEEYDEIEEEIEDEDEYEKKVREIHASGEFDQMT